MKKSMKNIVKLLSFFMIFVFGSVAFSACSLTKDNDTSYAISGYIYDDYGMPVEGVEISSVLGNVKTDKDGKYVITGIESSIIISASKEGYQFKDVSKAITSSNDDANFVAYKEYLINGSVKNNGVALVNANVVVSSLSGKFYTTTDETGKFVFNGVAGESLISCEVDELQFYELKTTIDNPNVLIETTSSLTINLTADSEIDYSKISLFVNGKKVSMQSETKVIDSIKCGSEIEIVADGYKLNKPSKFIVSSLNQVEDFLLSKIYDVDGVVKSGDVCLKNANIYIDETLVSVTDEYGNFSVSGIYGTQDISVVLAGFNFETKSVNNTTKTISFNGTKNICIDVSCDYLNAGEIEFSLASSKDDNGIYQINNVVLGQEINISSQNYFCDVKKLVVSYADLYNVNAYAKYNAQILVDDDISYECVLDEIVVSSSDLTGLYGKHKISAKYENYQFSEAEVTFENPVANLTYVIPYSKKISVKSGNVSILNFSVSINGATFKSNSDGFVLIENLVANNVATINSDNYNTRTITINNLDDEIVDLTYNACGYIRTGNVGVVLATVSIQNSSVQTDGNGYFEIKNISGQNNIVATKTGFSFEQKTVSSSEEVSVSGTYSISGKLFSNEQVYANYNVVLINNDNVLDVQKIATNSEGIYQIANLAGEYTIYPEDTSIGLMPTQYSITTSGENYNFSTTGFSVSGYVKTGNIPIASAKVVAGSNVVYTKSDGKFVFELLTGECEIYAEKEGYTFSSPVSVSEERDDLQFLATYKVSGIVYIGESALAGVVVSAGNVNVTTGSDGKFELLNLSGKNDISFEKENYVFESVKDVVGYTNNISIFGKSSISISVVSGDLKIVNFVAKQNGKTITVTNGIINTTANIGDIITFEKEGYEIETIVITNERTYVANATYSVSGKVVSGLENISGVSIKNNESQVATTNDKGEFSISGISGRLELTFEKKGFSIQNRIVSGYETNIELTASYKVTVVTKVGTKILSGVNVVCGTEKTTGENGQVEFDVVGRFDIVATKEGYTFDKVTNKFGEQKLVLTAYYSISGKVLSGTIAIAGADVSVGGKSTRTDVDGNFAVSGIQGESSLVVSKDGYVSVIKKGITDKTNIDITDMKYSLSISFDTTGVTVILNGNSQVVTGNTINLTGLVGVNNIKFSKESTTFSANNLNIKQPGSISITTSVSYTASGYVKTDEDLAVAGIKVVSQAGDFAVTDENGFYKLENVAGEIYISDENITKDIKTVTASGVYNFTITNYEFGYYLYANAYKNLDNASSFQIIGNGSVNPSMGGSQSVYSLVKKDNNGRKIKQNLNYGKEVVGVDPKVSLVDYFDGTSWYYDQIKDVNSNLTANHSVSSLKAISIPDYQSKYGASPDAYMPYNFNKTSGIKSISSVKASGNNYTFTIELNTSSSVYSLYATQMKTLSDQDVKEFSYIKLNYTITKSGWITSLNISEKYTVELMSVKITSDITYKFTTQKPNIKINDIDVSSDSALLTSLKESSQTEIETVSAYAKNSGNLTSKMIYGY